ncbi:uncharacterized protein LAESUDRAFT_729235 [Laetiporus sulphureus 93-53]|uniref:Fungal-type protein kinase domain-containing protein n=1 Tax=Laetiporus sulphureus 93-53 TaxID=1314785 RepID=A0A165CU00_9APHY|nr:uncharacterized protein LAESUDRAFT_729235 [Laetiporus sulphureus 93-53]KZT03430.1 hypothetical protein LAESUDRAFT_729235 [Laetiporus sulphureus 93-53]
MATARITPWPKIIMHSFSVAGASSTTSKKLFNGSWNRLLNVIFPPWSTFEIVPQFPAVTACEAVDFAVLFVVYMQATPVFVVEVKPLADFPLASKREEADNRLRRQFLYLATDLKIPVLHGISVFGTRMAFYKYDRDSKHMEPERIVADPTRLTDTAPKLWWNYDILEQEGADKLNAVRMDVKEMCSQFET